MMDDFLNKILDHKKSLLESKEAFFASLKNKLGKDEYTRYSLFKRQITNEGRISLIAEIKKASPSKGLIRKDFDVMQIAKIYVKHKADAISILTEEKYFLGQPQYIRKVNHDLEVPVLAKDFFVDEGQVYEARFNGASAILLIMAILDDSKAKELMSVSTRLDLDCLVEVHNDDELKRAIDIGAEIIGINNRDLHTFDVNMEIAKNLIPKIPKGITIVVESGISSHTEVKELEELGVHAVLIGETFMKENNIGNKIEEVIYGK